MLPTRRRFETRHGYAPRSVPPAGPKAERLSTSAEFYEGLARENVYLRQRIGQLQGDVTEVTAEADRLRQIVEHLHGRTARTRPDPLSGGQ